MAIGSCYALTLVLSFLSCSWLVASIALKTLMLMVPSSSPPSGSILRPWLYTGGGLGCIRCKSMTEGVALVGESVMWTVTMVAFIDYSEPSKTGADFGDRGWNACKVGFRRGKKSRSIGSHGMVQHQIDGCMGCIGIFEHPASHFHFWNRVWRRDGVG